ncbi:MAG: bifunctional phosphoribosylaminoimidazolecarboxamide formyltransferase/IMP cyclohydrolase, partial [Myxococcota bacterium]|nr:bifunctional phosphoribosylaminoimidazolecarboxamide formyltransferase/IMP cyclohydrolase [Myxococcota bacterium]
MSRYALLSVSDKTGIVELGRCLERSGFTLLSTGGTARALRQGGLEVTDVGAHTGHPEIMNGRVKTLHPRIHGGILGRRAEHAEEAAQHDIPWIDLVAVNLYPFEATVSDDDVTLDDALENIDIGGPTMVRAAAKNYRDVVVLTRPEDYPAVQAELASGAVCLETRARLAVTAFRHTAAYDALISGWLGREVGGGGPVSEGALGLRLQQTLRYGENPHQTAAFYADPMPGGRSLARARQLQGKELSFNNLADLDATVRAVFDLERPACVVVKHANPCGAAVHSDGLAQAFELALSADPVSAFGGIVAFNRPVDADTVRAVRRSRTFFEVLAAPGFSDEARELLEPRKKLRVLELPGNWGELGVSGQDVRRVQGGWLLQDWDEGLETEWRTATREAPGSDELATLRFAWTMCRHVKSNAIVLARAEQGGCVLNGVGAGQMSRVDS